ncbi:hypothetical protein P153DRAFT_382569 [Dothidotthia symphoricarpi CBS 119687]|uniref:F-box domain-containing protein n=1 Tax=Dothidotthia symphoricarpi CBS 119687 TaxID=1392245 RepID=A0A6A6API7_9PLEO|nr:uncharacterized protein P153DRAFT_382569 [Dothidotthia symphoricarpi CBS 119687]KAF2132945.1 hypothetical protein P153DRAFT_382569 [Dothidotthia symphoricarpi CBS 119687]
MEDNVTPEAHVNLDMQVTSETSALQTQGSIYEDMPSSNDYEHITKDNRHNSPLLQLPPEIRNRIYHLALIQGTIQVLPGVVSNPEMVQPHGRQLLYACRQIRLEASPIFFGLNTFNFDMLHHFWRFGVTRQVCKAVRSIQLVYNSFNHLLEMIEHHRFWFRDICPFPALEKIYVLGTPNVRDVLKALNTLRASSGNRCLEVIFNDFED